MTLVKTLRAVLRVAALTAVTLVYWAWLLASCLAPWLLRRDTLGWRLRLMRSWSRACCRIFGLAIEVRGEPPPAPFFLVSNHLSYTDVLVLSTQMSAVFVAKSEIASWPLLGAICRSVGTLFIRRSSRRDVRRVIGEMERLLDRGYGVLVFPEGGIGNGITIQSFRSPLLEAPVNHHLPVHHVTLSYRAAGRDADDARRLVVWDSSASFVAHAFKLLGERGGSASITFGGEPLRGEDRKDLAERLHAAVSRDFTPVAG
jgi:1-acyl-sn-glycerol-3-phosphate acyltransferase